MQTFVDVATTGSLQKHYLGRKLGYLSLVNKWNRLSGNPVTMEKVVLLKQVSNKNWDVVRPEVKH